ncbi:hypothetical protein HK405_002219, partial [Cladochytrium tenue]
MKGEVQSREEAQARAREGNEESGEKRLAGDPNEDSFLIDSEFPPDNLDDVRLSDDDRYDKYFEDDDDDDDDEDIGLGAGED